MMTETKGSFKYMCDVNKQCLCD